MNTLKVATRANALRQSQLAELAEIPAVVATRANALWQR